MLTGQQCLLKYGPPQKEDHMVCWRVPKELEIGNIPQRIYCNKDMIEPLTQAFKNLIDRNKITELKTWNGCFNIRNIRGGVNLSLHSWGVAIDVNAAENPFGGKPSLSAEFVQCFKDAGFDWGGDWSIPDGMHMQLKKI